MIILSLADGQFESFAHTIFGNKSSFASGDRFEPLQYFTQATVNGHMAAIASPGVHHESRVARASEGREPMTEPFPTGTRFLVGIVVEARTFEAARAETLRIVGDEAEVRYVFGRINEHGDESAVPQVITTTNLDGPLL